ncbi:MAG: DUF3108 domain-containing protein [Longimicrobiales bacterium]
MKTTRKLLLSMTAALFAAVPSAASFAVSQGQSTDVRPVDGKVAPVPFGPGERGSYKVTFGGIGVGKGVVEVAGVDTIRGIPAYHFVLKINGGIPFAHVNDVQESWMDVSRLTSLRFHQNLSQVKYKRDLTFDMFPTESIWKSVNHRADPEDRNKSGPLASNVPLDDISFMYWVRTIPLEVGKTYTFNRYFKAEGNPVVVKVLRRESVKVPAGTYNTIVLKPIIKTKGLFSEGGEAELYFSDDSRRMLVMLTSKLSIGSLKLYLEKYTPGEPLNGNSF